MKLNIGSGLESPLKGQINIDNLSGWTIDIKDLYKTLNDYKVYNEFDNNFIVCDAENMSFHDHTFDEIFSNQCVGTYTSNLIEISRVHKIGGVLELGLHKDCFVDICAKLTCYNYKIIEARLMNGWWEDVMDDGYYTMYIKCIKEKDIDIEMVNYVIRPS